eukprot:3117057-Pyramimonas_sp.AAC.1
MQGQGTAGNPKVAVTSLIKYSLENRMPSLVFEFPGGNNRLAVVPRMVPNFPELFVGYFLGSMVFAVQSYLMIVEVAMTKGSELPVSTAVAEAPGDNT